jgi:hypothetical protein
VHPVPRQAARIRRDERFPVPPVRRGQPQAHGIRADRGSYADVPAEEIRRVFARRIRSTSTSGRTPRSSASRPPDAGPARGSFRAAVAAADPLKILAPHLPAPPRAALSSPRQARPQPRWRLRLEKSYRGDLEGIAITRYGHGLPTRKIRVVEAGHPVPDEAGEAAARRDPYPGERAEENDLSSRSSPAAARACCRFPRPTSPWRAQEPSRASSCAAARRSRK